MFSIEDFKKSIARSLKISQTERKMDNNFCEYYMHYTLLKQKTKMRMIVTHVIYFNDNRRIIFQNRVQN